MSRNGVCGLYDKEVAKVLKESAKIYKLFYCNDNGRLLVSDECFIVAVTSAHEETVKVVSLDGRENKSLHEIFESCRRKAEEYNLLDAPELRPTRWLFEAQPPRVKKRVVARLMFDGENVVAVQEKYLKMFDNTVVFKFLYDVNLYKRVVIAFRGGGEFIGLVLPMRLEDAVKDGTLDLMPFEVLKEAVNA